MREIKYHAYLDSEERTILLHSLALFAYVQGLTTLATMENVHYAYKWEDKLTDLIGIFSCEF